ncbi:MAG TPA: 2Fe-2S iron-sulfur cluster binding domain-containing protein [Streptosporangiaceae bacterium]|jgi:ferredoxin-NADP reductase
MRVTFGGDSFDLEPGESVLDGMARHGIGLPASCRAGACHACLVRAVRGDPGPPSQAGLKSSWQADGYFLACLARPAGDLTVALAGDDVLTGAQITAVRPAGPRVIRVTLRPDRPLRFRAGQHLALHLPDGTARVYSIANTPAEAAAHGIELHVRVYPGGAVSGWLARAAPAARVRVGEPAGDCCYLPGQPPGPLLLAGTGTGIAPLAAVLRDARGHGHDGPAVLIHGASDPAGLYLRRRPRPALPGRSRWRACLLSRGEDIVEAAAAELAGLGDPGGVRAYLCGGRPGVIAMRRSLFLAGMPLRHIFADAFTSPGG